MQPKMIIKDVLKQCLEKLEVKDIDFYLPYFALYESRNGSSIDNNIPMDSTVSNILTEWQDSGVDKTAKFLFMIRLYVPSLSGLDFKDVIAMQNGVNEEDLPPAEYLNSAEVRDPGLLHLQFIQAVYNIITGRYPVVQEEALHLGAIHFILKFGQYRAEIHKQGFLGGRIVEFIPIKLLKVGFTGHSNNQDPFAEWENKLLERVRSYSSELIEEMESGEQNSIGTVKFESNGRLLTPERKYMDHIYMMASHFGCTFFKCTQKNIRSLPETVYLASHSEGIRIFDKSKKFLASFYIEDILRWGFKPNQMFYFEIGADNSYGTGTFEFETVEGKIISDLMTDYALAFLKEREQAEIRLKENKYFAVPKKTSSSVSSPPPPAPRAPPTNVPPPNPPSPLKKSNQYNTDHIKAAVKFQALYRGYKLRNDWAKEDAAILIQSIFRGYKARILLSKIIEDMIQQGQL